MWLIDKYRAFQKKRFENAVKSNLKTVKNPKAIREDRVASIEFFKSVEDPSVAVPALLTRFDFSLEHGINDSREKESVMEGIVAFKDKAIPHVKAYLRSSTRIAWPIKILTKITTEFDMIRVLNDCLDYSDVSFDRDKTDKNYDILCYLRDFKLESRGHKLVHFLKDHDERVRFAAVEALLEQEDQEINAQLEPFILDLSAENTRLRQAIIEQFLTQGVVLQNTALFTPGSVIAPGLGIDKDRRLAPVQ